MGMNLLQRTHVRYLALAGIVVLCCWLLGWLGSPLRARVVAEDEDADGVPGLQVRFQSLFPGWTGGSDPRSTRLVALFVPAKEPPTPFLPAGRFKATWQGKIVLELGGDYTFAVQGRGNVQVRINGGVVLEGAGPELKGKRKAQAWPTLRSG